MTWRLPSLLRPVAAPAALGYGMVVQARNARFDRGRGIARIGHPVISIGNVTTGGTGKTPMTAWIAALLMDAGHKPAIAMRGYKGRGGLSDEQLEYAQLIPDVPVIAHPDRTAALQAFLPQHPEIDCVLLDDGFQHRQVHRDLDLVLIDATADTFADSLLPAGNLREPLENLRRADAVIITHAPQNESATSNLRSQIQSHHGRPPLAASRHVWTHLDLFESADARCSHEIEWLHGKRVATMLGIAQTASVLRQIASLDATVALDIPVRDHQRYDHDSLDEIERILEAESGQPGKPGIDGLIVTRKDWVKLRTVIDWSAWRIPIVVPRLKIEVVEGERELRALILSTVNAQKNPIGADPAAHER